MNSRNAGKARAVDDRITDRWYEAVTVLARSLAPPPVPRDHPDQAASDAWTYVAPDTTAFSDAFGARPSAPGSDPSPADLRAELHVLAGRLLDAVTADPVDRETGHAVGASLPRLGIVAPEALTRTIEVLGPPLTEAGGTGRAFALLGAVAAGHGSAMRIRALAATAEEHRAELTALRQAERARRAGETRFRAVFENAGIGALVIADSGEILEANDTARQIAGRDLTRMSVGDLWDLVDPRDRSDLIDMWAATRSGQPGQGIWRLARPAGPDGLPVLVSVTTAMVDDAGAIGGVYFAVTLEDVTTGPDRAAAEVLTRTSAEVGPVTHVGAPVRGLDLSGALEPDSRSAAAARARLIRAIAAGLRAGEFVAHYQPIASLSDGRIVGVEALARWHHPHYGMVSPDEFIPVSEESGLIVPLGLQILEMACHDASRWMPLAVGVASRDRDEFGADEPAAPFVSVNISVRQLEEPHIVPAVLDVLRRTGLEPARLQLELVESLRIAPQSRPAGALRALAAAGIRVALDDFGTGYSNIEYLQTLPVGAVKIAGSFCVPSGADEPLADLAGALPAPSEDHLDQVIESMITMSHVMGHTVTVESVETREQADRMLALGADLGQGHLFGHPMCIDKLSATLTAARTLALTTGAAGPVVGGSTPGAHDCHTHAVTTVPAARDGHHGHAPWRHRS